MRSKLLPLLIAIVMLLTACGGGAAPDATAEPAQPAPEEPAAPAPEGARILAGEHTFEDGIPLEPRG